MCLMNIRRDVRTFINEYPQGFSKTSPAKVGYFSGYRYTKKLKATSNKVVIKALEEISTYFD